MTSNPSTAPTDTCPLAGTEAIIRPWTDATVDQRGHDPRSIYVERYWLGVLGPTATWIMRRFAECFDHHPDGFILDLDHVARAMGLSYVRGHASPFGKALHRCTMFGVAQPTSDGWNVRRRFPTVAQRHLRKLPDDLRAEHDQWARRTTTTDRRQLEHALLQAGLTPAAAIRATEAALTT